MIRRLLTAFALFAASPSLAALDPPEWTRPAKPFHIVGPIYYVGSEGLAAYLIRTNAGLILLDGTMEENVPAIEANIRSLGFSLTDVKILLNSHAHFDHAAGLAALKRDTHASLFASKPDAPALESGTPPSQTNYGLVKFPPVKVDRLLVDGQPVKLGDVAMIPLVTPGHTPGCTTWTMAVKDGARTLRVVWPCSLSVGGNILKHNAGYPGIVADYRWSFARMRRIPADVVLPAHTELTGLWERRKRLEAGDADAFVTPKLLPRLVADAEKAFDVELRKQGRR